MRNNVQVLVDRMMDSTPAGFEPKEIHASYAFKKKLGKSYSGLKVFYSIKYPMNSIFIK